VPETGAFNKKANAQYLAYLGSGYTVYIFLKQEPRKNAAGMKDLQPSPAEARAIVERLDREFRAAVEVPAVREQLVPQGRSLTPSTPEEFGRFIRDEIAKWGKVVQETSIKVE